MTTDTSPTLDEFERAARAWISTHVPQVDDDGADLDVAVFKNLDEKHERELVRREAAWQQSKTAAGFGALGWSTADGGQGLDQRYETIVADLEHEYSAPVGHELVMVTVKLVAPTVRLFGTDRQKEELLSGFLDASELCCQLFSEPGAGSDLASLATRARREGDSWVISGQKIWSSGAQFADWGLLLARTDPDVVKHAGITAFLVRLDTPGVQVRPIRQMSGGSSFAEVFLDEVRVSDQARLGAVGDGWSVALATLGFEREVSDGSAGVGGSWEQVRDLAESSGAGSDPLVRQRLARIYTRTVLNDLSAAADAARRSEGVDVGATGSLRKLQWVALMREIADAVTEVLGDSLVADTGRPGSYVWGDHVLGSIGYSVAGGTDEVQRNIIGERILGLPSEPRTDRGASWSEVRR
ncbi:acyl-CoA dehydrogenase family protein [Nocardioides litoris]|uniref:acyl-CoA dehydrogenase family protein n=1 Tax=Nocardioides litoris TaxID=1926648 RepID=UPI001121B3D2|nr:acyl-CoA dehydrogenase family protein [Nocardioides litoris]